MTLTSKEKKNKKKKNKQGKKKKWKKLYMLHYNGSISFWKNDDDKLKAKTKGGKGRKRRKTKLRSSIYSTLCV